MFFYLNKICLTIFGRTNKYFRTNISFMNTTFRSEKNLSTNKKYLTSLRLVNIYLSNEYNNDQNNLNSALEVITRPVSEVWYRNIIQ